VGPPEFKGGECGLARGVAAISDPMKERGSTCPAVLRSHLEVHVRPGGVAGGPHERHGFTGFTVSPTRTSVRWLCACG